MIHDDPVLSSGTHFFFLCDRFEFAHSLGGSPLIRRSDLISCPGYTPTLGLVGFFSAASTLDRFCFFLF